MTSDRPIADDLVIRRAEPRDATGIGDVWLASWRATFEFPPSHPDDDVRRWLADELVPNHETWVAVDRGHPGADERVVGLMAVSFSMVEQLYLAPDWIGRGLGRRLIELAKTRRPTGLELFCFQANQRARSFYEHHGFLAVATGDGSNNQEHQPDIRYAWRPHHLVVASADGTPIAVFSEGSGPPLILVHGASADHTTFRVVAPLLAKRFTVHAIDRRGRGASGDTLPYAIEREFEDIAAVASVLADEVGGPVDVLGHSYGGRCGLGAALATTSIRRVVSYEGAPTPPGERYGDATVLTELRRLEAAGDGDALLTMFMTRVVGLGADDLARYRADPVWPVRVAAAHTISREVAAEGAAAAGLDALAAISQHVLQLVGAESRPEFGVATRALNERLAEGRILVIEGAKHAAHHTHPEVVVAAVTSFLGEP